MSILVHITNRCNVDARSHGQTKLLENLSESIRKTQNLTGFEFPPTDSYCQERVGS